MRTAKEIVEILLEDRRDRGVLAFGPGYPPFGYFFPSQKAWSNEISRFGLHKQPKSGRKPTTMDAIAGMLDRGYSFVIPQAPGQGTVVMTAPGVKTISAVPKALNNLKALGLEPDSIVVHRQGVRGPRNTARLNTVVLGLEKGEGSNEQGLEKKAVKPQPPTPEQVFGVGHPVGAPARNPAALDPYHVTVNIGLETVGTPNNVGVRVLKVDENSPAARAGFRQGDIIFGIGRYLAKADPYHQDENRTFGPHRILTLREWNAVAGQFVDGDTYEIRVIRSDGETTLALIPDEKKSTGRTGPDIHIKGSEMGGHS